MLEERTFVAQTPDELQDEAIKDWADGLRLRVIRLDERIEEVRDLNGTQSNPRMDIKRREGFTLPYYYRVAAIET